MVNKLLLVSSCLFFLFSCKQSTGDQSKMPDLSEFKKVEEPVKKTSETTEPVVQKETPKKESNAQKKIADSAEENDSNPVVKSTTKPIAKPKPSSKSKPKPNAKLKPQIQFEEPVYEFGEITEGDIIEHKFAFKNTGKAELIIKTAKASCGCTNPSFPFLGIAPGETGFIGVTYNSVSKDGPQKPEITITTNVDDTSLVLYLSGVVLPQKEDEDDKGEEGI